jgi:hypothetical protein
MKHRYTKITPDDAYWVPPAVCIPRSRRYIEIPNEKWFLANDGEEEPLYEFDNGIFVAHQQIDERVVFEPF